MTVRHALVVSADQNLALLPDGRRAVAVENVGGCCFKSPSGDYVRCALFDLCGHFIAYCGASARRQDRRYVCWKLVPPGTHERT